MKTVLVYGATGSQSRPVAQRLLDAGFRVRVITRDPGKAADLERRGAQIARADMADRDGLRDAHRGVDAVSLLIPAFGDILGGLFGPEAGAAAERGYEAIARDPDLFSPTVDMDAVLPMLPVTLTSLEAWARHHAQAFSPAAQAAAP